jgi:hypothetical protein
VAPSLWNTSYIPYYFASSSLTFGSTFNRKWNTKVHFLGNQGDYIAGNMSIQVVSVRDNQVENQQKLPVINYLGNPMWGDPSFVWQPGDSVNPRPWAADGKVDVWRRFPAGQLRCDTRQIILEPAYLAIYASDMWPPFCLATITGTTGDPTMNVAIATPSGYSNIIWPLDCVGYNMAFDTDGYVQEFPITYILNQNLTINVPHNFQPISNVQWVIRGYKKSQRVHLNSLTIYYDYLGDKNSQYLGKTSAGENAT